MKIVKQNKNKMVIKLENGARITIRESETDYLNSVGVQSNDSDSKVRSSYIDIDSKGNIEDNSIFANFKGNFTKNKSSFVSSHSGSRITTTDLRPNIKNRWGLKESSICTIHHK
jgi:hypothetical protein